MPGFPACILRFRTRLFSTVSISRHENPLGLPPRSNAAPQMPRRGGPIQKRCIPHVSKVIAVASGKGGVGKSTVAVNLAFALAMRKIPALGRRLRVGILDLDIFGPSVPTLMGLRQSDEPALTSGKPTSQRLSYPRYHASKDGAMLPIVNHGLPTMSMGYLLPKSSEHLAREDAAIVWRGLMVQKAVQQLLFDVDWRDSGRGPGLDVLVVDMPPGTGDVPLTLGQLVVMDGALDYSQYRLLMLKNTTGAVIVSTPQDVALADVRRGITMFRKISVPIIGTILNQAYFVCPACTTPHELFGPPDAFRSIASTLGVPILGELPLVTGVSTGGDKGAPYALTATSEQLDNDGSGGAVWRKVIDDASRKVWESIT